MRLARLLESEPPFQCVDASEYEIADLILYGDLSNLHHLGAPKTLKRGYSEDDGGGYIETTYRYNGLDVTIVRGKIDVIETRGPRWPTPSGLKPGMTQADAMTLLGLEPDPDHLNDGVYSFSGCPNEPSEQVYAESWYFEFAFGKNGAVSFVRLVVDRP